MTLLPALGPYGASSLSRPLGKGVRRGRCPRARGVTGALPKVPTLALPGAPGTPGQRPASPILLLAREGLGKLPEPRSLRAHCLCWEGREAQNKKIHPAPLSPVQNHFLSCGSALCSAPSVLTETCSLLNGALLSSPNPFF